MKDRSKTRGVFERPPGSGIWWISYFDAERRWHREKVGRRSVAIDAYHVRKREVREGIFIPPAIRRTATPFRQLADERMALKKATLLPLSYKADEQRLKPLLDLLGSMPARSITPDKIDAALEKIASREIRRPVGTCTIGGATVNRYRTLLSSIFRVAVRNGRIPANPLGQVARRRESHGRVRFLSPDEERKLRKSIRAEWRDREPELDLALNTGMRRSEQFNLRWEHVDIERKSLTVHGKGAKRRFLPINAIAKKALLKLHRLSNGSLFVCPDKSAEQQQDFRTWFETSVEKSKIAHFCWHDLRHTFASRLVINGVDLRTVQELLGHASIVTTMRYAHLSQAHQQSAVEKLVTHTRTNTGRNKPEQRVLQMPVSK